MPIFQKYFLYTKLLIMKWRNIDNTFAIVAKFKQPNIGEIILSQYWGGNLGGRPGPLQFSNARIQNFQLFNSFLNIQQPLQTLVFKKFTSYSFLYLFYKQSLTSI